MTRLVSKAGKTIYKPKGSTARGHYGLLLSLAFFLFYAHMWCEENVTHLNSITQTHKVKTEVPLTSCRAYFVSLFVEMYV